MASQKLYSFREFIAELDSQEQKFFKKLTCNNKSDDNPCLANEMFGEDGFLPLLPNPQNDKENGDMKMLVDEKPLDPDERKRKYGEFGNEGDDKIQDLAVENEEKMKQGIHMGKKTDNEN